MTEKTNGQIYTYSGAQADAIAASESAHTSMLAAFDADNAQIADLTQKLADCEASQPSPPDPIPPDPPQPKGLSFTVTVGANDSRLPSGISGGTPEALKWSYSTVSPAIGGNFGKRVKFFGTAGGGTSGINKAVQMEKAWPGLEPVPLMTNEIWDPKALDAWMDTLTKAHDLCYLQEFMDKVGPGLSMSFDTYNGRMADLRAQIDAHKNGKYVGLRMVGNEAIERKQPAGQPYWKNFKVPERTGIGNDTYVTQPNMLQASKGAAASLAWFKARQGDTPGVRGFISEFGISRVNFTNQQRIDSLQNYVDTLGAAGFSGLAYWATCNLNEQAAKDWSVDRTTDKPVADKVKALVASTNA